MKMCTIFEYRAIEQQVQPKIVVNNHKIALK